MLPPAETNPDNRALAATTLPAADTAAELLRFWANTLPDADTRPEVPMLPPVTLPVTVKLVSVPTEVRLLLTTLLLRVLPVSKSAAGELVTPVKRLPLPRKNPAAVMLPVEEICELAVSVPSTVAPVLDTDSTLCTPRLLILTAPFCTMVILELPLAIPVAPEMLYSSLKLSLHISNAVRIGVPLPSLGALPMLIICCAIARSFLLFTKGAVTAKYPIWS